MAHLGTYITVGISIGSFLLSVYATWRTVKIGRVQEALNQRLLQKENNLYINEKKADLVAQIVTGGRNSKMIISNQGKSVARNIQIEFVKGGDFLIASEYEEKFPLEALESGHSVDLIAAISMQTKHKHELKVWWEDDSSITNEKTLFLTI